MTDAELDALVAHIPAKTLIEAALRRKDPETALGIALPDDGIVGETVGDVIGMVEGVVAA